MIRDPVRTAFRLQHLTARDRQTYRDFRGLGLARQDANMIVVGMLLASGRWRECVVIGGPPPKWTQG